MGRNLTKISENTNTEDNTTDEFITEAILKKIKITVGTKNEQTEHEEII